MKKRFGFVALIALLFVACFTVFSVEAQTSPPDTTLNVQNVASQVNNVITAQAGQNTSWKILFFAAIVGVVVRIILNTIKGVKDKFNGSPLQFAWSYWIKDNALPKIATVLTFILSSNLVLKLPGGWVAYVIFGVVGLLVGYFLDWVYSTLKGFVQK